MGTYSNYNPNLPLDSQYGINDMPSTHFVYAARWCNVTGAHNPQWSEALNHEDLDYLNTNASGAEPLPIYNNQYDYPQQSQSSQSINYPDREFASTPVQASRPSPYFDVPEGQRIHANQSHQAPITINPRLIQSQPPTPIDPNLSRFGSPGSNWMARDPSNSGNSFSGHNNQWSTSNPRGEQQEMPSTPAPNLQHAMVPGPDPSMMHHGMPLGPSPSMMHQRMPSRPHPAQMHPAPTPSPYSTPYSHNQAQSQYPHQSTASPYGSISGLLSCSPNVASTATQQENSFSDIALSHRQCSPEARSSTTPGPRTAQVQSLPCTEEGCKRRFRPKGNQLKFCRRHQEKHERRNALAPHFVLVPHIRSFGDAKSCVYQDLPRLHIPNDDVGVEAEDVWIARLLQAVNKEYEEQNSQYAQFHARQQKVFNGKGFNDEEVNVRMRFLYQAALRFHMGGDSVYPKGGDNEGYGNADKTLTFSARMNTIIGILKTDKRVCMDVIEGRGVTALVGNPDKYEKRKTQNKDSNTKKQEKQKMGDAIWYRKKQMEEEEKDCEGSDDEDAGDGENDLEDEYHPGAAQSQTAAGKRKRQTRAKTAASKPSKKRKTTAEVIQDQGNISMSSNNEAPREAGLRGGQFGDASQHFDADFLGPSQAPGMAVEEPTMPDLDFGYQNSGWPPANDGSKITDEELFGPNS